MKQTLMIILCAIWLPVLGQNEYTIIPTPLHQVMQTGHFSLNKHTAITATSTSFDPIIRQFVHQLNEAKQIQLKTKRNKKKNNIVIRQIYTQVANPEAYTLNITKDSICILAESPKGAFYGLMSLLQLVQQNEGNKITLSCGEIYDAPQYKWRGFMLDESRHFFGKEEVKKIIDWMAYYKLNRFHWHLTDEPAWRLQIKQYPKLTTVGAIGDKWNPNAPARFYTQSEVKEIVAYAKQRFIKVIPEIDMPGHATAANKAYPQYSGGGEGKFANFTFNPGREDTYQYLTNILKETATLFPAQMIHIGGDEVSFGSDSWLKDTAVLQLMKAENLKTVLDVEKYFVKRMADSALKYYRKVLGWDEIADNDLPRDSTIVFWWRHDKPQQLYKALNNDYDVVFCPRIPLYFDFVQDASHKVGRTWSGDFASLEKVYNFSPFAFLKNKKRKKQILGLQANLWTETVYTNDRLEYMLFPRMAALAEAAWTKQSNKNYSSFLQKLNKQIPLYKKDSIHFYNPINPTKTPEIKK